MDYYFEFKKISTEYIKNFDIKHYSTIEVYNKLKNGFSEKNKKDLPYTVQVCTELQNVIKFNFVLFRLIPPMSTLTWHIDDDLDEVSYHIPITSNEGCYYIYEDRAYNMQSLGSLYLVRTNKFHTFMNAGITPRLHLHFVNDLDGRYVQRNEDNM